MSLVAVPSNSPKLHTGCGYVLVITLIACFLLVANSFIVRIALGAYQEYAPAELSEPRAQQALQIVMPVLLIFLEYWIYDRLVDRVRIRRVDQS